MGSSAVTQGSEQWAVSQQTWVLTNSAPGSWPHCFPLSELWFLGKTRIVPDDFSHLGQLEHSVILPLLLKPCSGSVLLLG